MKAKTTVGIMLTLSLIITFFTVIPVKAARPRIIVGVIGPVGLPHWSGMWAAAQMAADEINGAPWDSYPGTGPGVNVGGTIYDIQLESGNEFAYPTPSPIDARNEMIRLITVKGCQFIIGGFRTECTASMIPVAMDYQIPFIIDGSSTTELVSCYGTPDHPGGTPPGPACGHCVYDNYAKYKYLFRVTPPNSTCLVTTIMSYIAYSLIGIPPITPKGPLLSLYGYVHPGMNRPQVDVAVLTEDLEWTQLIHYYLTTPAIYPKYLGPYANVTYAGRILDGTTDCSSWLNGVKNSKARLMIHIFSGVTGVPLIMQWKSMNVKALPLGINVMAQLQSHWTTTGGACEGEAFLDFSGTRSPIVPGVTEVFWDKFVARTGVWPIYTAWGAYESTYVLRDAIQRAGTLNVDGVVTELEKTDAKAGVDPGAITGNFKFTGYHDVFCSKSDVGPGWYTGYVRPFVVQWQAGRKEVVGPINTGYSRMCALPNYPSTAPGNAMYPYPTDVTQDGKIDTSDISKVSYAFGSSPGSALWQFLADADRTSTVDTNDLVLVANDFPKELILPLPYCDETGKWKP